MAWEVQADVWKYSRQKGTAKLTLLAIADSASKDDRRAFIRLSTIAAYTNQSIRWTRYTINRLVEAGELIVYEEPGRHNWYEIPPLPLPQAPDTPPAPSAKMAKRTVRGKVKRV